MGGGGVCGPGRAKTVEGTVGLVVVLVVVLRLLPHLVPSLVPHLVLRLEQRLARLWAWRPALIIRWVMYAPPRG